MSESTAKRAREQRLAAEREEKIVDRTIMLAVMGAFLYPTQGDQAIDTASMLIDQARDQAEKEVPVVE